MKIINDAFSTFASDSDLSGATFIQVSGKYAINSDLTDSNFVECNLGGYFKKSTFKNSTIISTDLVGIEFTDCIFKETAFASSNLKNVLFKNCKFINCDFNNIDFNACDFVSCNISKCHFTKSDFNSVNISETQISDSLFLACKFVNPYIGYSYLWSKFESCTGIIPLEIEDLDMHLMKFNNSVHIHMNSIEEQENFYAYDLAPVDDKIKKICELLEEYL